MTPSKVVGDLQRLGMKRSRLESASSQFDFKKTSGVNCVFLICWASSLEKQICEGQPFSGYDMGHDMCFCSVGDKSGGELKIHENL